MRVEAVRNASERELADFHPSFVDERLDPLLLHYKARSFPNSLSEDEVILWEKWRSEKITKALPNYIKSIEKLSKSNTDNQTIFLLHELQFWAENVMPSDMITD
jgi:exodeoxyribonuclease-1